jgi:Pectate lyase superfamily protein
MMRALLAFALLLAANPLSAEIIPPDRRIEWSPGVRGGIPTRTDIINVRSPPFNATGDGTTDDRIAIQHAINAAGAGQVVYLPRGTYRIGAGLYINKSISLRGDGPDATTIDYTEPNGIHILKTVRRGKAGPPLAITMGSAKDSSSITVSSAAGIGANDYILITHNNIAGLVYTRGVYNDCHWCGQDIPSQTMTQINKVLAKSGDRLTLERPLYFDYVNNPVVKHLAMLENVGFEDLLLRRSNPAARNGHNLYLDGCANCWVKNVTSVMAGHRHIQLERSYANTVRDSWFSGGYYHGSDHSYGIFLFGWNSDHLIENNIVYGCRHALILEGGGSGNVFGYNYAVSSLTAPDYNWLAEDVATHGPHPFMNLFEGNVVGKLTHDNTWGSASHNTTFRSWLRNYSSNATTPTYGRYAVDVEAHSYFNNIVGSIIGRQGDAGARYAGENVSNSIVISYRLGFHSPGGGEITDTSVRPQTLIHGNYDHAGGGIVWDSNYAARELPPSLYLRAKPVWFGALTWPAFGPDLRPMEGTIPAQARYEGNAKH